jgi:2,4-dienoyl-CoA reductase-like NADH-dependent reductase (Old Yellow Enzyme family)
MSLHDPVEFRCGARMRNRLSLAPLTNLQSHADGSLSDDELRWLVRRAQGGFGVVCTCASHVSLDGQGWAGELGIFDDRLIPRLRELSAGISAHGALGLVQIFHGGVRAPSKVTGEQPWSASAFHEESPDFETPREGTKEDIARVIGQFREAALRAHEAGFQGVEIHGAHGYLLSQFLSATMNQRDDAWGGSYEGRARLMIEVTKAVRTAVPGPFVVGVRLSPEDFGYAKGLDLDENLKLARSLSDEGADFIHLSLWKSQNNTQKRPDTHPIPLFREACGPDVRIFAAGAVWTRAEAEQLVARGADVVALGRAAILNPEWPAQISDPSWEPRRPPMSSDDLVARDVSPTFVEYLRRWKGFVQG